MNAIAAWFSEAMLPTAAPLAADIVAKATVLLFLALLATAMLRRSSAAVRHRVWCLTFAGLLLLPALSALLPEWRLEVLPKLVGTLRVPQLTTLDASPAESGATAVQRLASVDTGPTAREGLFADPPTFVAPGGPLAEREDYGGETFANPQERVKANDATYLPPVSREPFALAALWLLGAIIAASPLAFGLLRNYLLRRRAQPVAEPAWTGLLDELCARLSLRRRVALYETPAALMPMTWGLLSPIVMLPRRARGWTQRLRRFVLLHELAHVKRFDVGFQMLARLACAFYWFHPLAWYALRRMRIERELACDDCVVQAGERPSDYAAELLAIARNYQPLRLAAAVPMAQTSNLERRIRALFDRACSHLPISPRAARLLLLGTAVIVTTIAVIRLVPRAAAEAEEPSDVARPPSAAAPSPAATDKQPGAAVPQGQSEPQAVAPPSAKAPKSQDDSISVRGRVLDPAGKPLPGARVRVIHIDTELNTWVEKSRLLAETKSDANGTFTMDFRDAAPFATSDQFVLPNVILLADAPGLGFGWEPPWPGGEPLTLQLVDDAVIEGRILDLEGRPIAGVNVTVEEVSGGAEGIDAWIEQAKHNPLSLDPDRMTRPIKDYNTNRGQIVARFPSTDNVQPGSSEFFPSAVTDAGGRFRLAGLGRDRSVRLRLEGPRIAKTWLTVVTHDMPPVPYPSYDPRFRVQTCFGRQFDLTAEPEQPIAGTIRDADTGEPLPGIEVRLSQYAGARLFVEGFVSATTDESGRYTLRGVPKPSHPEQTHRLRLLPGAGRPYFKTEARVPKQQGLSAVTCDIGLKRGITARGKVTDANTGKPVRGLVAYVPFLSNQAAATFANFVPGHHTIGVDEFYATDEDGRYEIPALPGRGVVALIAEQADRYPEADGADDIADLYPADRRHLNVYHLFGAEVATALREVNLSQIADDTPVEIAVRPLPIARLELADPEGRPLVGVVTKHLVPTRMHRSYSIAWSYEPLSSAIAEIIGPRDTARTAMFLHRERRLAAAVRLSDDGDPPAQVVLQPCATMTGRVVDAARNPVAELWFEVHAAPLSAAAQRDQLQATLARLETDAEGRFRLDDVPPGLSYVVSALRGAERLEITTKEVQPGETLDLGDVMLKATDDAQANGADSRRNRTNQEKKDASSARPGKAKIVRGRVSRDARPASGAHLAVIGDRTAVGRGGDLDWGHDVLAEATANKNGEYVLRLIDVSQQTHNYPRVIARLDGSAIAWRELNLDAAETQADFELKPEEPLRGKLVDLEGQPAAGVRLSIASVVEVAENEGNGQGVGYRPSDRVPAAWIAPITSDAQGRFVVHGLAANQGVTFEVAGDDRFALQDIALNTGSPEERGERDRTYRPLVKNVKQGEEAVLALAPAQVFEGMVRYADSGKPVPHARLTIWASQEELGSMMSVAGSADEQGRYHITPRPGIRFGLTAYPPAGAPYLVRTLSQPIHWEGGERIKKVDLTLPRGVLVRGTIVEAGSSTPVAGAAVQYYPESSNNPNDSEDIVTRWQSMEVTDNDGRFTMAVLPGPGRLLANGPQGKYVLQEISDRELNSGMPGGTRNYFHAVAPLDPKAGQEPVEVKLELQPGAAVKGSIVDEAGKAIDEALVISRLNISPYSLSWRGHTTPTLGGQFELAGLAEGVEYPVYFLDPKRRLGATQIIKAGDAERTVVIKPCGKAALRLIDEKGEPAPQYAFIEMVVTPGASRYDPDAANRGELAADADFISNVDRMNNPLSTDDSENGVIHLSALIPGASYRVLANRSGRIQVVKEFQVKPDETIDLGEITIERE